MLTDLKPYAIPFLALAFAGAVCGWAVGYLDGMSWVKANTHRVQVQEARR